MKDYKLIVIALLIGITAFTGYRYFNSLKERYDLQASLQRLDRQVSSLEEEKTRLETDLERERVLKETLDKENLSLKDTLKQSQEKLLQLDLDFQDSQKTIESLNSQVSAIKNENTTLRDQIELLSLEIAQAKSEKDALQARMDSIEELKKAIRQIRIKMRKERVKIKQRTRQERTMLGNLGYFVRDGKPTFSSKVRIEVQPLPGRSQ